MNIAITSDLDLQLSTSGDVVVSTHPEDAVAIGLFSDDGVIRSWGNFPEWANAGLGGSVDEARFKRAMAWIASDVDLVEEGIKIKYQVRVNNV